MFWIDMSFFFSLYTGFVSGFFLIIYGIVLIAMSREKIYVLISLFSLALWQLLPLSLTLFMTCFGLKYFTNGEGSWSSGRSGTSRQIAIGLLVVVVVSIIMTVVHMYFIMRGRRRGQQCSELSPTPMVFSFSNPIHEKN